MSGESSDFPELSSADYKAAEGITPEIEQAAQQKELTSFEDVIDSLELIATSTLSERLAESADTIASEQAMTSVIVGIDAILQRLEELLQTVRGDEMDHLIAERDRFRVERANVVERQDDAGWKNLPSEDKTFILNSALKNIENYLQSL